MPRKKKTEEVQVEEKLKEVEEKLKEVEKPVDYGTGWTGKNNRIQAGIREEKNE